MDDCNSLDAPTVVGAASAERLQVLDEIAFPQLDGYEIMRELGRGGMGIVYLAKQVSLGRMVALKTMPARSDDEFERLLLSEAQIVAKLNHPGIIPIYEARTSQNFWCFSMGLVVGEDLAHRLARGVFSADQVASLAEQVSDALQHAHEQGVLHLDIKPANILLDQVGNPKLADFGISALLANATESLAQVGTPQFMSPEQAAGDSALFNPASDIYSLGAVMYAALTGRPPIVSANTQDLIAKIISARPAAMRQAGVRVPLALEAIVFKCLEKDPENRYRTAAELQLDLLAFQDGKPVKARPPGIITAGLYQLRQHVFAASISGSLALLLLILLGMLTYRSYQSHSEINSLLDENQRLKQLAVLQQVQFRSSISANVAKSEQAAVEYQLLSSLALRLNELGDTTHAARYAAEAFQLAEQTDTVIATEVQQIILDFGKRLEGTTTGTQNTGLQETATPDTVTQSTEQLSDRTVELGEEARRRLAELVKKILESADKERTELERSQQETAASKAELAVPDALKVQQGEK